MKRVGALLISLLFLLGFSSACAEPTNKRGLIEFCELYMQRFTAYQKDYEIDYDVQIIGYHFGPLKYNDNYAMFSSTAGSIDVYLPDYTVSEITMTYSDFNAEKEVNERNYMSCMMALSALEYDYLDDRFLYMSSKVYGGASNATDKAFSIWSENVAGTLIDNLNAARETGNEVKIYSGNYDYFIAYNNGERDDKQYQYYYLIARAHK